MEELIQRIYLNLTAEIGANSIPDPQQLRSKVRNAVMEVKMVRHYPENYDDEMIFKDLRRYEPIMERLALFDFNQMGAEGETMHIENNTQRMWRDRAKFLRGVIPITNIV